MKINDADLQTSKITLIVSFLCLHLIFLLSCSDGESSATVNSSDSLTEEQTHLSSNALKGLTVFNGLEVRTVATEPTIINPTNIDVDDRGRIWVTEAYNYRPEINGNPTRGEGDRIMILEDRDGDGVSDSAKVFYQGPELNAPLGICVLGNRVLVSQSPYIWAFYDDNGDDKADRKEVLFQGIGGEQHDHGAHAFTFGPDGKLYFNLGNEGRTLKDKTGKPVRDQDGDEIGPKKYKEGMAMRCDPDGSNVEVLGQNFRNPYEVAVDSYGTMWQSDNDDDGNRGTRINYVMDYGKYGYKDEMTGAGWQESRTNAEDSTPLKHWHLNDPGVVPNMLQTFAGSPTGMVVYEGSLLPAQFHNQIIHCDPGPNVIRSYPVKKNGAGYSAEIVNILKGEKDQWFRPADVCVAPDGSLIVADWYDPGVGGHQAGDQTRGRIYRIAPANKKYTIPVQNYTSVEGAINALQNPNLSVRFKAWTALQSMGKNAVPALENLWTASANPRMQARAFWALVKMEGANAQQYITAAMKHSNADFRIIALRAARQAKGDVIGVVRQLVNDPDVQVRRECALALHHNKSAEAPALWATLASMHDGKDRWYLEALGIGAHDQWKPFFAAYLSRVKDPLQSEGSKDIVWRSRTNVASNYLAQLASDKGTAINKRLRYFRAFDYNEGPESSGLLLKMIEENEAGDTSFNRLVLHHLNIKTVKGSPLAQNALSSLLNAVTGTPEFVELVRRYELKSENEKLLDLAISKPHQSVGRDAATMLFKSGGTPSIWKIINGNDTARIIPLLQALSGVGSKESVDMLQTITLSDRYPLALQKQAGSLIGKSEGGADRVIEILKAKKVPVQLIPDVVASVQETWRKAIRTEASTYLPNAVKSVAKKAPALPELLALQANAANGKTVFMNICASCHQVGNEGYDFGPKLTEIGSKYPKDGLLRSIVYPSEGIAFNSEGWIIKLKDGSTLTGILASKTETDLDLKLPGGSRQKIKTSDVTSMKQMKVSMMPEGLHENLSAQQLADLLEYLKNLKKKA